MQIKKFFLQKSNPIIEEIKHALVDSNLKNNYLDLSAMILGFSNTRASRRLLELLAIDAKAKNYVLTPPVIITVGALPELLYHSDIPLAGTFEESFAWVQALKKFSPDKIKSIIGISPKENDFLRWLNAARDIQNLYSELSGACISFTEAGERISQMPGAPNVDRWWVLADVHRQYLIELAEIGLADKEEERKKALKSEKLSLVTYQGSEIILCAVRDMNNVTRGMLERADCRITALIHATESEAQGFDEFACVVPSYWKNRTLNINKKDIIPALDSADQALAALTALQELNGRYSEKEIAIGFTNNANFPHLQGTFKEAGIHLHNPGGEPLSVSKPAKLLSCIAKYLNGRKYRNLFELIRFPEVELFIKKSLTPEDDMISIPAGFDDFQMEHLQSVSFREIGKYKTSEKNIVDSVSLLSKTLEIFTGDMRPLDIWIGEIHKLLMTFFPDTEDYKEEFDAINDCLNKISETQRNLLPFISGVDAVNLIVNIFGESLLPKERDSKDIDALGWLELQMEDTPVMIITGMNEGLLPESINADSFLPESVRKHLGIVDNEKRYAREAFVLSSLISSVKFLKFIYTKIDSTGSPLLPSRLLVNKDDLIQSVENLYITKPEKRELAAIYEKSNKTNWEIPPRPLNLESPVVKLPVTAFRRYIECPYRFYLDYILGLRDKDDLVLEMDGRVFGTLAHNVMAAFNQADASHTSDEEAISKSLSESLNACFFSQFGSSPLAPVIIQREQLRKRLNLFSKWHAKWRAEGWVTKEVEFKPDEKALVFNVDGKDFLIQARIDRIDYHKSSDTYAVFDYKFSEKVLDADKAHSKGDAWIDLQLPLYYHILRNSGIKNNLQLGYLRLSPGITEEKISSFVDWSEEQLNSGLEAAFEIIRKIRAEEFWPPSNSIKYTDKYSALLGTSQFFEENSDE